MIKLQSIPDNLKVCKYWTSVYRLLPRKQKFFYKNIELRYGLRYFIYSKYSKCYYEREILEANSVQNLLDSISKGIVYLNPNEEQKEEIKAEMEQAGLSYYDLQLMRLLEYSLDVHTRLGDRSYAYASKKVLLENKLNEIYQKARR